MAVKPIEIKILTDADQAVRGFNDVDRAAEKASSRFDNVADRADNLDSKSAAATGSLGALSSGFELVGLEKYATGLQSAALATDFFSGVGQGLNLIMQSTIVTKIKDTAATVAQTAATVAHTVATKAAAAAAKTWAVAQRVLNLALAANPIGLVVVAVAALVAGIVLAYNKSATFRGIVQDVGRIGQQAFGWIVDKIQAVIDIAGKVIGWFRDKIPAALEALGEVASRIGGALLAPFNLLKDAIEKIIDLISKIKLPDLGDIPIIGGLFRSIGGTTVSDPIVSSPAPTLTTPQTVELVLTADAVSEIERGQRISVALKAYIDAGGTVVLTA